MFFWITKGAIVSRRLINIVEIQACGTKNCLKQKNEGLDGRMYMYQKPSDMANIAMPRHWQESTTRPAQLSYNTGYYETHSATATGSQYSVTQISCDGSIFPDAPNEMSGTTMNIYYIIIGRGGRL